MATLATVMDRVRGAVAPAESATDGQLLTRFLHHRDADAFAALVCRLGPTVLAVCRRACPDSHLAEDAFQAAFLVLARKADTVRPREQVSAWLYGVAFRTASKARTMLLKRRHRETTASPALPDPPELERVVPDDEELRALDAAVARLPDHLRTAVVLCELEGRSRKDVAKQLGVPEGTLSSRLAKARKLLGDRLRPMRPAVVPAALTASTANAASGGQVTQTVITLAEGATKMLFFDKLKLASLVLLAVTLAGVGALAITPTGKEPAVRRRNAPVPKERPKDGVILLWNGGKPLLLSPDGKVIQEPPADEEKAKYPGNVKLSPDGTRTAVLGGDEIVGLANDQFFVPYKLTVRDTATPTKGREITLEDRRFVGGLSWSRDGKRLYVAATTVATMNAAIAQKKPQPALSGEYAVIDVATGKATELTLPEEHFVLGEATDGRLVVGNFKGEVFHRSTDGKKLDKVEAAYPKGVQIESLSADGGKVLLKMWDREANGNKLAVLDLTTAKVTPLTVEVLPAKDVFVITSCWSPDGKKILFLYQSIDRNPPPVIGQPAGERVNANGILCVADVDGKNSKVIREDADGEKLTVFDWR